MTSDSCSTSSRSRRAAAGVAVLVAAILAAGPRVAAADDVDGVRLLGLSTYEVEPGSFATISALVENRGALARQVRVHLSAPPGWSVVTGARTVRVGPHEQRQVPFIVNVPERAAEGERHEFLLALSSPDGTPAEPMAQEVRVAPHPDVALRVLQDEPMIRPGDRAHHVVRVENPGNVSNLYTVRAECTPAWPARVSPDAVFLRPGETADVAVEVDVPRNVNAGALVHVRVVATASELDVLGVVEARADLSSLVAGGARGSSRFRRLPLEVSTTYGRDRADQPERGLRMVSDGSLGDDRSLYLETDFRSDRRGAEGRLSLNRVRAHLEGREWEVALGDVWSELADVVLTSVSGRGGRLRTDRESWSGEAFVHVAEDDRTLPAPRWGGRLSRELRRGLWLDGSILQRRDGTIAGADPPRDTFLTLAGRWNATPELEVRTQGAWSRHTVDDFGVIGYAGGLQADYRGERFLGKARATSGDHKFAGRIGDERAFVAHARAHLAHDAVLWTNLDVTRHGPGETGNVAPYARNLRIAARKGDPGSEFTFDDRVARTPRADGASLTRTDVFTVWHWRDAAPLRFGLSTRGGWKRDDRESEDRLLWGIATEVIARIGEVRTTAMLDRSVETDWRRSDAFLSFHGDVSWVPARHSYSAGLGFKSHAADAPGGVSGAGVDLRPRAAWRLNSWSRVQLDAGLDDTGSGFGVKEWTLQFVWSGADALPLPWATGRETPRGLVFLDADGDGLFGPGDTPMPGVRFRVDGQPCLSGDGGAFDLPPAIGIRYRVELDGGSIPVDLVPSIPFPCEAPATGVAGRMLEVPLVRAGRVTGSVFRDENHDGARNPGEPALADIRLEILRDGEPWSSQLTDYRGTYTFPKVPAGEYVIRVATDWMPAGWEATGAPVRVVVVEGDGVRAAGLGLAPRRKPILKTFQGAPGGG